MLVACLLNGHAVARFLHLAILRDKFLLMLKLDYMYGVGYGHAYN